MRTLGAANLYTTAMLTGVLVGVISAAESLTQVGDWPHWLGPNRDGSSPERGLLREWPKEGPQVLWRAKIGPGWGAASISKGEVFLAWTEPGNNSKENVACLDAATGREAWKHSYGCDVYWKTNVGWPQGGVRATPCVTDKAVYSLGVQGHLFCLDRRTGKPVWSKELAKDYPPSTGDWKGFCFSPLLVGKMLVLYMGYGVKMTNGSHGCFLVGLDSESGKEVWKYEAPVRGDSRGGSGQTPAVIKLAGKECVLITADQKLLALDPLTGKEAPMWSHDFYRPGARGTGLPTPLVVGDCILDIPDLNPAYLVRINRDNPAQPGKVLWKSELPSSPYHNFAPWESCAFGFLTGNDQDVANHVNTTTTDLLCLDLASGKVLWKKDGFRHGASQISADGLLFVRSQTSLVLVEASPKGYAEKGRVEYSLAGDPTGGRDNGWVMPTLSRGNLYVRLPQELVCYKVSDDKLKPKALPVKAAVEAPKASPPVEESKAQRLLRLAQEMEKAGQKDAARQSYEQIVKEYANDPVATLARERIARLSAP